MNFKVNSKELEKLLTKIIPAVPTRTPMPILEYIMFDLKDGKLTIYATDLEISLISSTNVVSEENFKGLVPAKLLYDVVRTFGDTTILFEVLDNGKLNLSTENGKYTLSYLDTSEYPEIPSFPNETIEDLNEITISGSEIRFAFEKTYFAMSKEEIRPAMMGTLFEFENDGLRFVTTDSHRLVDLLMKNIKHDMSERYVIPEKAISVLLKILDDKDVKLFLSKSHISFRLSDIELITRLISQEYPDYASVVPLENELILKVKTRELLNIIKRMMLFSTTNTRRVKFSISENNIEISAEDPDIGASGVENLKCEYSNEPLEIGFNSSYVNDVLSHLVSYDEIIFKLHSSIKAAIITPEQENENFELMMLLMPVRLNNSENDY